MASSHRLTRTLRTRPPGSALRSRPDEAVHGPTADSRLPRSRHERKAVLSYGWHAHAC